MIDFSHAYRVGALSLDDKVGIFTGNADPRTLDTSACPVGSLFLQTNGLVWKRKDTAPSDWAPMISADEIPQMTGGNQTQAGTGGAVPAPPIGGLALFLRGDGTWAFLSPLANPNLVKIAAEWPGDIIQFNGTAWVNVPLSFGSAGSSGVDTLYSVSPVSTAVGAENAIPVATLSAVPSTNGGQILVVTATNAAGILGAWVNTLPIGRTTIPAGKWTVSLAAGVDTVADDRFTWIVRRMFEVMAEGMTITTTGTGTTRIVTAASGAPLVSGDADPNMAVANYLQTPKGLYQITGYVSPTVVTIAVPIGYINESGVAWHKWRELFVTPSGAITSITPTYMMTTWDSVQEAFPVASTSKLGAMDYAAASGGPTEITLAYDGTQDIGVNTCISTPISLNNLLTNVGDMIVMGANGVPVRLPAGQVGQVLTANGAGTAPSWQ